MADCYCGRPAVSANGSCELHATRTTAEPTPARTPPTREALIAALCKAHELIQHYHAVTDPDAQPDLAARADAILLPCDEADYCPALPVAAPHAVTPCLTAAEIAVVVNPLPAGAFKDRVLAALGGPNG